MDHLTIIKVGGKVLEDEATFEAFLHDFERIRGLKLLVHGGGNFASEMQQQLGQKPVMVDGRRVTDKEALKVVTMVYGGLVNKQVVARLNAGGVLRAVGLTGADGGFIKAHRRPVKQVDYGFVGDIDSIDMGLLHNLLTHFFTPVIAPLASDSGGQLLNINADSIAQAIAVEAAKHFETVLMYCFDKPGVLHDAQDDKSVIPFINKESYSRLKSDGIITDGMIPKLDNAFAALESGVTAVRICSSRDLLTGGGTTIVQY